MATLQTLFNLADPRIQKIWDQKTTQLSKDLEYDQLGFTDFVTPIQNPQFQQFTGLGYAVQTGEAEPYAREDIAQTNNITIPPLKFTKAISISEEMLRFNLWPQINNLVEGVANSLNATINLAAAKIFYLGFGTTYFTGPDSAALFTTHTMNDGSTQSNSLGAVPLSYDNLKTAAQTLDRLTDDKGIQLMRCRKLRLIVARENEEKAKEILRSIGNPDSANRVNNVFNEGYIDYRVANWIPSTTYSKYWFLIDMERAAKMAQMVWGWKPRFDKDNVINNGTKIYTGSTMFQPGFSGFQFAVGSNSTT